MKYPEYYDKQVSPFLQHMPIMLIRPHASVPGREWLKASVYLFFHICIITALLIHVILVSPGYTPGFAILALATFTLIYVIARTKFYELSKFLTLVTISIFSMILMWFAADPLHYTIAWLSLPGLTVFAWLSYPRSVAVTVAMLHAIALKIIILIQSDDPVFTLNAILLTVLLLISVCAIIYIQWYYNRHIHSQNTQTLEREEQFRKILDEIPAMVSVRSEGRFLYINPYGANLLGYTADNLIGQPLRNFIEGNPETGLPELSHVSMEDRVQLQNTFRYRTKNQELQTLTEVAIPIACNNQLATLGIANVSPVKEMPQPDKLLAWHEHVSTHMTEMLYTVRYEQGQFQVDNIAGNCLSLNRTFLQMLFARNFQYPLYASDEPVVQVAFQKIFNNEVAEFEQRLFVDGRICQVEHTLTPVLNATGDLIEIYGRACDKTDYLYLENALEVHMIQQAVIAELGLLALSESDALHLLNHSLMLCRQLLDMSICEILLFDAEQNTFKLAASTLDTNGEALHHTMVTYVNLSPEDIFSYYDPIVLDADKLRFLPDYLPEDHIKTGLSMPIRSQNQHCAILNIYASDVQHDFSDDDIYFIQSIANILGTYLAHRDIQAEELRQRQYATALQEMIAILNSKTALSDVLDAVLDCVAKVVPAHEMSSIFLRDDPDDDFVCVSSRGYEVAQEMLKRERLAEEDSLVPSLMNTRKAIAISDVHEIPGWVQVQDKIEIRAYLGAPIFVEDVCIGLLNVDSTQLNVFTDEDAARLETFVHHIGIAIQNARQHEIMEQRVTERTLALAARQDQLQAILDATGEGIFYTEGMYIQVVNEELCRITGFTQDELIGQSSAFLQPDDLTDEELLVLYAIPNTVQKDNIWRGDIRLKHKVYGSFYAGLTIAVAGQQDDGTLLAVTIVRDVSELKKLEQMKNRFIASAAHELRNPVMNFNLRMYRIRKQQHVTSTDIDVLDRVVKRMNRLVGNLLDLEQLERKSVVLKREPLILQDIVQDVLMIQSTYADEQSITLQHKMPESPVYVFADAVRLEQVFTNLIANAIAYTDEGGDINVSAIPLGENPQEQIQIIVQDTGVGIPANKIDEVFQPFIRVHGKHKATGTGLGLSITREIIKLHGGEIRIESQVNEGSRFIVTLPVMQVNP